MINFIKKRIINYFLKKEKEKKIDILKKEQLEVFNIINKKLLENIDKINIKYENNIILTLKDIQITALRANKNESADKVFYFDYILYLDNLKSTFLNKYTKNDFNGMKILKEKLIEYGIYIYVYKIIVNINNTTLSINYNNDIFKNYIKLLNEIIFNDLIKKLEERSLKIEGIEIDNFKI